MSAPGPAPVFLAGPTACGKSALALHLAAKLNGEIISVDSMQVYRGMNIGTAKPTAEERARVPHHLLDVVEVTQPFDAAQFVEHARTALAGITARGRRAIFCGGTGLYFRAWLDGLGAAPPSDPALRAELAAMPLPELLAELDARDPETAARIDRQNPRRVIRAVQIIRLTGRPCSASRVEWSDPAASDVEIIVLDRADADLRRRIDERVDAMFAAGLVAETEALLAAGLECNLTAMQALGYRQVVAHLREGVPLPETVAEVKRRTWQFARRQRKWFRRDPRCRWHFIEDAEPTAVIARLGLETL